MNQSFMKEKPVFPLLTSMALPMVISMLVNSLYNIIDSFFVAQISEQAMTALSLVYPVQNLINAIAIGFGVGMNALIALCLGAGDVKNTDRAATHGMLFSVVHGIVITVVSIGIMPFFLSLFTKDTEVLQLGTRYASIAFSFSLIIMLGLAFEKIFQAVGNMKITMAALLCGCITNIILDPLLIFGIGFLPRLGIAGAALATGIGQIVTLSIYLVVYFSRPLPVHIRRCYLKPHGATDKKLYAIGVPAILNLALPSLLVSFLNALLAGFSQSYVVVLGIYYKLQTFLYLPANGIIQGMRPIIGYNYGARQPKRITQTIKLAVCFAECIMLCGLILAEVFPHVLLGVFNASPTMLAMGILALRIIAIHFPMAGFNVISSSAFQALGRGTLALLVSVIRQLVVLVPAAWLLSHTGNVNAVWFAFPIAELVAVTLCAVFMRKCHRDILLPMEAAQKTAAAV